jgi:hypothetical protein
VRVGGLRPPYYGVLRTPRNRRFPVLKNKKINIKLNFISNISNCFNFFIIFFYLFFIATISNNSVCLSIKTVISSLNTSCFKKMFYRPFNTWRRKSCNVKIVHNIKLYNIKFNIILQQNKSNKLYNIIITIIKTIVFVFLF